MVKISANKKIELLRHLDFIRMNAEGIDWNKLLLIREEIIKMLEGE